MTTTTRTVTREALLACIPALEAVEQDRALLAELSEDERRALLTAAGRISRPESGAERRLVRAFRKKRGKEKRDADLALVSRTGMREQRKAPVYLALPDPVPAGQRRPPVDDELHEPRACYVCKADYRKLHFFYFSMCPRCGDFNYGKRTQKGDLQGRVAVVTGARVKIGFQASLMLLRNGCTVVATTRFPRDAARRYAREADFASFKDRLHVYGLDLRHTPSVELFARQLDATLPRLDFILNNACQTVRRPPGWFAHMIEGESHGMPLSADERTLVMAHDTFSRLLTHGRDATAMGEHAVATVTSVLSAGRGGAPGMGAWGSAQLSQVPYDLDDASLADEVFPQGRLDADLQQVDLRRVNSWRLKLDEVTTPELLEVQLVNAVAPFVLNARLKPLMLRHASRDKHIVNVSAMEGVFSRGTKTARHPHTNMAKAALNMLTRTSAQDYVKDGIHMNAVDTGWVTDEDPAVHAERKEADGFQPPLDIVDGAARIVDPIFTGLATGEHVWGKFLKDYVPADW